MNKSTLLNFVPHPNIMMQLPSKCSKDVLGVLVASHLSAGKCANLSSADDECMQLIVSRNSK